MSPLSILLSVLLMAAFVCGWSAFVNASDAAAVCLMCTA